MMLWNMILLISQIAQGWQSFSFFSVKDKGSENKNTWKEKLYTLKRDIPSCSNLRFLILERFTCMSPSKSVSECVIKGIQCSTDWIKCVAVKGYSSNATNQNVAFFPVCKDLKRFIWNECAHLSKLKYRHVLTVNNNESF